METCGKCGHELEQEDKFWLLDVGAVCGPCHALLAAPETESDGIQRSLKSSKGAQVATFVAIVLLFLPLFSVYNRLTSQRTPNHVPIWEYDTPALLGSIAGVGLVMALFTVPGIIRGLINYRQTRNPVGAILAIVSALLLIAYTAANLLL